MGSGDGASIGMGSEGQSPPKAVTYFVISDIIKVAKFVLKKCLKTSQPKYGRRPRGVHLSHCRMPPPVKCVSGPELNLADYKI